MIRSPLRNFQPLPAALAVLICLGSLWTMACSRGGETPQERTLAASASQARPLPPPAPPPQTAPAGEPPTNELRPVPQSFELGTAPPAPAAVRDQRRDESELAARERRLADRQAAIEAREQQLRRREQAQAAAVPGPPVASGAGGQDGIGGAPAAPAAGTEEQTAGTAPGGLPGAPEPPAAAVESDERQPQTPVTVPAGISFEVELTKGLASNTSSVGETFRSRLVSDLRQGGALAIPAGSEVLGVVTDAVAARRIGGRAKLTVKFTDLVLPTGVTVPMRVSFLQEGKSKAGRDAATIGGSTAGGALLGRILGNGSRTGGTILGALVGAAVGTAIAAKTAGEEVVIPEGSVISLKLDEPLTIEARRPDR
ncbi:MAG TPA: hypothetical protein VKY89_12340 [Thermoanaerobaculia bacterium]|nr:hypothetical protein [Thermoanaerobaculia bacterium]